MTVIGQSDAAAAPARALTQVDDAERLALLDAPAQMAGFTRWDGEGDARRAESAFVLTGMYCAACSGIIEGALKGVAGVEQVQVSAATQRATVRFREAEARPSQMVKAVRAAGYDAAPDVAASARQLRQREARSAIWRLFVASFCAMQVMMLATPSYVSAPGEIDANLLQLLNWGQWVLTLPVLWFSAGAFFKNALRAVVRRRINMDVPISLGLLVALVASSGATFAPGGVFGHEVYYDSLTMFVSFLLAARYLEMRARHRAALALEHGMGALPQVAQRVLSDGSVQTVTPEQLVVGDIALVPLGAAYPCDGALLDDHTRSDESLLSGESRPVEKRCGDGLVGGAINLGAPVRMRVERPVGQTQLDGIVALMRDALSQRPAVSRWADGWAAPFLWVVLALAAASAIYWWQHDASRVVPVVVAVLIVTCPCALSLAAPAALVAAAGRLARQGVLLRRLDALQVLSRIDRIFFDKTGTLTSEQPLFSAAMTPSGAAPDGNQIVAAQALAVWSRHPLAQALAQGLEAGAPRPEWSRVVEEAGAGLEALDAQGQPWRLGSYVWVSGGEALPERLRRDALAQVWFGPRGEPKVGFEFDEFLRGNAHQAVRQLQQRGVQLALLSGDDPRRVERLAERLGICEVRGGATPHDKLARIEAAQAAGERVAMVGDGVNDAPVLARADVSFAMGSGALVARGQADAIVTLSRIDDIAFTHGLAQRTRAVVAQNLTWAALYNLSAVPLALVGMMPPWLAGLGMALSSLLVVANAARLGRWSAEAAHQRGHS